MIVSLFLLIVAAPPAKSGLTVEKLNAFGVAGAKKFAAIPNPTPVVRIRRYKTEVDKKTCGWVKITHTVLDGGTRKIEIESATRSGDGATVHAKTVFTADKLFQPTELSLTQTLSTADGRTTTASSAMHVEKGELVLEHNAKGTKTTDRVEAPKSHFTFMCVPVIEELNVQANETFAAFELIPTTGDRTALLVRTTAYAERRRTTWVSRISKDLRLSKPDRYFLDVEGKVTGFNEHDGPATCSLVDENAFEAIVKDIPAPKK